MLAMGESLGPRRAAHPRTLATWRALRAYPGAPPRIPHGLTPVEFRENACKACHERGGFSVRFNAYVPVTPHPEMGACLQCHVGDATLMAIPLPNTDPSSRCRQCHTPGGAQPTDAGLDWRTIPWTQVIRPTPGRTPPPITHDSPMRVNCLTCHSSPSGVAEIQITHAERANCRQCHVQANAAADTTNARTAARGSSGAP
jgi:cytochrome c-type protein NapB